MQEYGLQVVSFGEANKVRWDGDEVAFNGRFSRGKEEVKWLRFCFHVLNL